MNLTLAVIGPICSSAKLQLNPKPEQPDESGEIFTIPFVSLDFVMDELAVGKCYSQLFVKVDQGKDSLGITAGHSYKNTVVTFDLLTL